MLLGKNKEDKEVTRAYRGGERKENSFSRFGRKNNFQSLPHEENEQQEAMLNEIKIQENRISEKADQRFY